MTFTLPTALLENDDARSRRALTRYFLGGVVDDEKRGPFVGRHFDTWGSNQVDRFTSDDIVAVSFLSVTVPARHVPGLVLNPSAELVGGLTDPAGLDRGLHEVDPDEITPDWAPWRLWTELMDLKGVGRTICSKLIARKRPHLIPIWDTVVGTVVGPSKGFWLGLCTELRADGGALHEQLVSLHSDAGLPSKVTPLRTFDVIAWMEGKGYDL